MNDQIREKIRNHPCYCEKAHTKYARIHLPVAPECNIGCNYCSRKFDCVNESRPGVTSKVISPDEAADIFVRYKKILKNLSVVGIAGPGDPLANPYETFKTFELIRNIDNEIKLCISTNGLELINFIYEIRFLKIDHVTITINTTDEKIGSLIYSFIRYKNKVMKGESGAKLLIENQMNALKLLPAEGIIVKVNTILIPGINDANIPSIAKMIKKHGGFIHNIIPLMHPADNSTKFSKKGIRPPTDEELTLARFDSALELGSISKVMKHCKQCRSDAVGLISENKILEVDDEKLCTYKSNC
ncbi:MAG: nitrogenase cofactor biosynthesis protein NifB [Calditerrivibrio sp.]|nr:nitrogenase cofactor biosynthesis protein NifB [Calditerrivibrio sp.]